MSTQSQRRKINRYLGKIAIPWMPINEIPSFLERQFGQGFSHALVIDCVRASHHFAKAWNSGGRVLMASNRAHVSHFVRDQDVA